MSGTYVNVMEMVLNQGEICLNACDYQNKEWYASLRENYPQYIFVKDSNKSLVYFWPKTFNSDFYIGNNTVKKVEINIDAQANVISRLLESKIAQIFSNNTRHYKDNYSNSNIIINKKQLFENNEDLLINRAISYNVSFVKVDNKIKFYLVLDTQIKKSFAMDIIQAKEKGINFENKWVKNDKIIANEHSIDRYLKNMGLEFRYKQLITKETSLKKSYSVIKKTFSHIKNEFEKSSVFDIDIDCIEINNIPYSETFFNTDQMPAPKRYYYNDKEQVDNRFYDKNLSILKPHSYTRFNKKINIAVIFPKAMKGTTEEFLANLKTSIKNLMHIPDVNYIPLEIPTDKFNDYKTAIDLNINNLTNINLAIIVVAESMKTLETKYSPYYYCKAKFLGRGISTQEIRIESLKKINDFILNNITLNIYAKIGGTPWTIETINSIKEEYIIGITSTTDYDNNKIMGFANVFDYSGTYCTGNCTSLCNVSDYKENFKKVIKIQLQKVIKTQSKDVRFIFHLCKSPSNDNEICAIQEIIDEFKDINIEYCFVKASFIHNYRLFENEGSGNVRAGKCVFINDNQALINFTKNIPAYVVIDRRSTFKDLYYICKQLYFFSHLSVRGFKPSPKSATLLYPHLMMNLLTKLTEIPNWDSDALITLEDKLWFV